MIVIRSVHVCKRTHIYIYIERERDRERERERERDRLPVDAVGAGEDARPRPPRVKLVVVLLDSCKRELEYRIPIIIIIIIVINIIIIIIIIILYRKLPDVSGDFRRSFSSTPDRSESHRLPDGVRDKRGRRRSAAIPPNELSRGNVGKMLRMAKCDNI